MKTYLTVLACVLFVCNPAHAHYPHDVNLFVALSPDFGNDQTAFATQKESSLRPTVPIVTRNKGQNWTFGTVGMDNTSQITSATVSPDYAVDQTVYVTTTYQGLYRSTDGGFSWSRVNQTLPTQNLRGSAAGMDASGTVVLLVSGLQGGVYRTTDAGASWQQAISGSVVVMAMAVSPNFAADGLIVAGDSLGGVRVSTNHGNTFTPMAGLAGAGAIVDLAIAPSGEIFAGTTVGLYRSDDGGQTFDQVTGIATELVYAVAVSPAFEVDATLYAATSDRLLRSSDGGATWQELNANIYFSTQSTIHFLDLQISNTFETDGILFLAAFEGMFRSSDRGDSWIEQETRPPTLISSVALSPDFTTDGLILASTDGGGLYVSADHGATWGASNRGLTIPHTYRTAIAANAAQGLTMLATQKDYALVSTNNGANWTRKSLIGAPFGECIVSALSVSPAFATDQTFMIGCRKEDLRVTRDGGETWQVAFSNAGLAGSPVSSVRFSPNYASDSMVVFTTSDGRFMRSLDGGVTWAPIETGLPAQTQWFGGTAVSFSPSFASDGILAAATARGIYFSTNGGNSWFLGANPLSIMAQGIIEYVEFSPNFAIDRTIIASVRGYGVCRTTNGGASWQQIGTGILDQGHNLSGIVFSPDFTTDGIVFGWSNEHLLRSVDRGLTFQPFDIPLVRHEDWRQQSVKFSGNWPQITSNQLSGTTLKIMNNAGRQAYLRFWGTGVRWIGIRGGTLGIAAVYIDRQLAAEVDQYAPGTLIGQTLYAIENLPLGEHEIHVVLTGNRNPASAGNWTTVDAFDVIR